MVVEEVAALECVVGVLQVAEVLMEEGQRVEEELTMEVVVLEMEEVVLRMAEGEEQEQKASAYLEERGVSSLWAEEDPS